MVSGPLVRCVSAASGEAQPDARTVHSSRAAQPREQDVGAGGTLRCIGLLGRVLKSPGTDRYGVLLSAAQVFWSKCRSTGMADRVHRNRDVLSLVTAVVLAALGAVSAWAVLSLSGSTEEVARAISRVRAYQVLQEAVASQAFAEAGVRRAPSSAAQLRLDAAVQHVDRSILDLRTVSDPGEGAMLSYLALLNDRYVMQTRASLAEQPGTRVDDRVAGPALDGVQELVHAAIVVNQQDADAAVRRQGRLVTALAVVLPGVLLIAAAGLIAAVRSSRQREHELSSRAAEAHHRAVHDPLTGLLNRAGFDEALRQVRPGTGQGDRFLLLVDLDHFKGINDAHGHEAGDRVLRTVSARMAGALRPEDALARLGGDEFAVLLRSCSDPAVAGERLREAVAQPLSVAGTVVVPTISIGAAPMFGPQAAHVMSAADRALYVAKARGRNTVEVC